MEYQHGLGPDVGKWERVDARTLGQLLAAQNLLFVLPDKGRMGEFFAEALRGIPGCTSCSVCLTDLPPSKEAEHDICAECVRTKKQDGAARDTVPADFSCGLASYPDVWALRVATGDHTFGFFVFRVCAAEDFEPYVPFLHNLANVVALSLENRMQKRSLERTRDELEERVRERTEELSTLNSRIRNINQELEQRVAERTAQLEAANRELEAFTYSVSHDLRTPLRGIDGFSQLLLEQYYDQLDQRGKDYLGRVRSASMRMADLIEDLLKLSRVGRSEMHLQEIDLSQLAHEIGAELQAAQPNHNVTFTVHEGVTARGDGRLLQIVLENLLGNAWKYTSKHTTAHVEFGMRRSGDRQVYFVRDDGAGFDMNYKERLFGAFQRLHTSGDFPGIGVGLATVHRIISRHGGEVWAEGEIEKGATVYFTLP